MPSDIFPTGAALQGLHFSKAMGERTFYHSPALPESMMETLSPVDESGALPLSCLGILLDLINNFECIFLADTGDGDARPPPAFTEDHPARADPLPDRSPAALFSCRGGRWRDFARRGYFCAGRRQLTAGGAYLAFWQKTAGLQIDAFHIAMPLQLWINDSLMAGAPGVHGWGIPMAMDIAFVVGCMAILGPRIPNGLRIMLLSLAIADDIGAILVIAVGYAAHLNLHALLMSMVGIALFIGLLKIGVRNNLVFLIVGILIWFEFHACMMSFQPWKPNCARGSSFSPCRFSDAR
jgi:hypothetical protein